MRAIDANELKRSLAVSALIEDQKTLEQIIDEQPTIERKTGKWIAKENRPKQEVFICSECGGWAYSPWIGSRKNPKPNRCKYTFCPNCGADMRGDGNETD